MEVYKYCLEREGHVRAIKGESKPQPGRYYRRGRGWFDPGERGTERVEVPLWLLDVGHYQDMLAELIDRRITATDENGDATTERVWHLNARTDSEYSGHMSNLVKVAQRDGAEIVTKWKPKTGGARVDLRDCEGYQVAAAYMHRIHLLPPLADFMEQKRAELAAVNQQAQNPRSGTGRRTPDGRSFISTQR